MLFFAPRYYAGALILGKWDGPTEAQLLSISLYLVTGITGMPESIIQKKKGGGNVNVPIFAKLDF